eukprot:11906200-Heterocapsa_arctica.AAC.1
MLLIHDADPGKTSNDRMIASELAGNEDTKVLLNLFMGIPVEEEAKQEALEELSGPLRRLVTENLASRAREAKPAAAPKETEPMPMPQESAAKDEGAVPEADGAAEDVGATFADPLLLPGTTSEQEANDKVVAVEPETSSREAPRE